MNYSTVEFDTGRFPLANVVKELLEVKDLARLPGVPYADMQDSIYHRRFYEGLERVLPIYRRLVAEMLDDLPDKSYFQRVPTFRVHLRGSMAVASWHRDRDFGHHPAELNYWLPLTEAYGTNTMWLEGEPVELDYGQIAVFDGANLLHGNKVNDTPHSRVSLDFRAISREAYKPRAERTVSSGMRFLVGEYWDLA